MPKYVMEFQLPEELEDFELAKNGASAQAKLDDIWEVLSRPAFKHGYSNPELAKTKNGARLTELLAELYRDLNG